jgi:glycosyltransferase involved in cell wall biosynthesis
VSRILLVAMNYAPELSGTAPYTTGWAHHLAEHHDVAVLAGHPHYPEWRVHEGYGGWRTDTVEDGVRIRRLHHYVPATTSSMRRAWHEISFALRVLTQQTGTPDVVLAVSPPLFGALAASRHARRCHVPFGLVVQDIYTSGVRELGAGHRRSTDAIAALERRVVNAADGVLTIHDRFANTLRTELGADPSSLATVGNWTTLPSPKRIRERPRSTQPGQTDFVVLHAGNMGVKQGLENVVAAARIAEAQGLPIRYVLMGDGNQRPTLQRAAGRLSRLEFLPSADPATYTAILRGADLLLVNERPDVAEMSLPSKLTSYCAVGRPIVAAVNPSGATANVIRETGAGILVPPGEPELLNEAALRVRDDPDFAARLGTNGLRYSREHHSQSAAMAGYDAWLDRILSSSRRGSQGRGEADHSWR